MSNQNINVVRKLKNVTSGRRWIKNNHSTTINGIMWAYYKPSPKKR